MNVVSSVVAAAIRNYIADLSADVVLHAMEIAAEGDKHDFRYIRAILDRYKASGLKTIEDVKLDEKRAKASKQVDKADPYARYDPNDPFAGWDEL